MRLERVMNSIRNALGMLKRRSQGNQGVREIGIPTRFSTKFITRSREAGPLALCLRLILP